MGDWVTHLPVQRVRIARPTNQLDVIVHFYRDILGLQEIGRFEEHDGYTGVMLGLPDLAYHLEFVTYSDGIENIQPTREDLLVFYIDDQDAIDALAKRFIDAGYQPVEPENPYWAIGGISFEDPDGWGLVFMNMPEHNRLISQSK